MKFLYVYCICNSTLELLRLLGPAVRSWVDMSMPGPGARGRLAGALLWEAPGVRVWGHELEVFNPFLASNFAQCWNLPPSGGRQRWCG